MAFRIPDSIYSMTLLALFLVLTSSATSFAKLSPVAELNQAGLYGRVHSWNNKVRSGHKVKVQVPKNAPIIISDFHSNVGANGLHRSGNHRGVDIFAKIGTPVIAAADGLVIRTKNDRCWGPTVLIKHGLDKRGKRVYGLYGHMRNIDVKAGEYVQRGQKIAEMGEDIFTSCGAGIHHLHFQISYKPGKIPLVGWGWANFVMDGAFAPNPHNYWENGAGKITCFEKKKKYSSSGLTYPIPCKNGVNQKKFDPVIFAHKDKQQNLPQKVLVTSTKNNLSDEILRQGFTPAQTPQRAIQTDIAIVQIKADAKKQTRSELSPLEQMWAKEIINNE